MYTLCDFSGTLCSMWPGPVLEMDADRICTAFAGFSAAFPGVRPHFATKCNPDPGVLRILRAAGCHFEIASLAVRTVRPKVHDVLYVDARIDLEHGLVAPPEQSDDLDVDALDHLLRRVLSKSGNDGEQCER